MAIRLIVNADDYGRTPAVSEGIRRAHLQGVVTSTTAMMNMPGVEEALKLALRETPKLGLGVHLVLTSGAPLLPLAQIPSLVTAEGRFAGLAGFFELLPGLNPDEAEAEWRAQIERFVAATGKKPDHLDSHHHSSFFTPALFRRMCALAREYGCAIRFPGDSNTAALMDGLPQAMIDETLRAFPVTLLEFKPRHPDCFLSSFYDADATLENLLDMIAMLNEGTAELMCHPGLVDKALLAGSVYNRQRERELAVLTAPEARKALAVRGARLTSFGEL
ncbi:MAG TPA: carbohydrate deacetylase [Anaerolineaceae bacterium]|nr:carbohydrate deacetylase [Anaerolineaceae bacterium]HPN51240.1 carbohydrate deacetylase [Anaerolineaceae bacterium]